MGLLSIFSRAETELVALPSGSFTMDKEGRVLASTLPQSFPLNLVRDMGNQVLEGFRSARMANLPFTEIIIRYPNLKLTARELGGGAIVFLVPQTLYSKSP